MMKPEAQRVEFVAKPLNTKLYEALLRRFGIVKISNEGQRWLSRVRLGMLETAVKHSSEEVVDSGEHYRVNCPYCNDKRYRLYINYRWNTYSLEGKPFGRYLIYCFNENCNMSNFEEELKPYVTQRPTIGRPHELELDKTENFKEVTLPGQCVPVCSLPDGHPALQYIKARKFDPGELSVEWGLHYCATAPVSDDYHAGLVRGRLIIPVFWHGKMVGWQTRAIDEKSSPKYYTMPGLKKTKMLFNGDRASQYKFGVVVEGVFDAFRVGPRAVAVLGCELSYKHRELILDYWSTGAVCIVLDPEALDDLERMERISAMLNPTNFRWGSFTLMLPYGEDPGSMDRDTLWNMIIAYAHNRNIPLASMR